MTTIARLITMLVSRQAPSSSSRGEVPLEDRDEGRADGAAGQHLEHQVRDRQRGDERLVLAAGAELLGDDDVADQPEQAADRRSRPSRPASSAASLRA